MLLEPGAKLILHEALLLLRLEREPDRRDQNREQPAPLAPHHSRAEHAEQHPRVDRVANSGVRAGGDELVIGSDDDAGAPLTPEVKSRPDRESNADGRQESAESPDPLGIGNESTSQETQREIASEKQAVSHSQINPLEQPIDAGASDDTLPAERHQDPDQGEQGPESPGHREPRMRTRGKDYGKVYPRISFSFDPSASMRYGFEMNPAAPPSDSNVAES